MPTAFSPPQISNLAVMIERHFIYQTLDQAVQLGLNSQLQHYSLAPNLPAVILDLCRKVNAEGRLPDLVKGLLNTNPAPELRAALAAFSAAVPSAAVDPFEALLVTELPPVPMINRQFLRNYLRNLVNVNYGYRVISVDGPTASGKTYSKQLIQHIAASLGATTVTIEVVNAARALTLQETVKKIAFGFSSNAIAEMDRLFPDKPTDAQSAERFVDWAGSVSQGFATGGKEYWLLLDGLDRSGAEPVRDLLVPLLLKAIADRNVIGMKLFLLGDDATRVGDASHIVLHESTRSISEKDIGAFLTAFAAQKGYALGPAELTQILERVIAGTQWPFDHKALQSIRARLELIVPRLCEPNKPLMELLESVL